MNMLFSKAWLGEQLGLFSGSLMFFDFVKIALGVYTTAIETDWEEDEEYNYEDITVKPEFSDLLSLEQAELDIKVSIHIYMKREMYIPNVLEFIIRNLICFLPFYMI